MRERVSGALADADADKPTDDPLAMQTRALARRVLERDCALGWHLADHPAQLSIYTIDAFCASIARRAPITTRFGAPPRIDDETVLLHREAVGSALVAADPHDVRWRALLDHVDNDTSVIVGLLTEMLAKRDQWLKHLVGRDAIALRRAAEATLTVEIESELTRIRELFPAELASELASLLREAATNLADNSADLERRDWMERCAAKGGLPDVSATALADWKMLAGWMLTGNAQWRKRLNVEDGFPGKGNGPGSRIRESFKTRMTDFIGICAAVPGLRETLDVARRLPPPAYDDASWNVIAAMLELLPRLAAQLKVTFADVGVIDPSEAMLTAIDALGEPDAPSDLLLRLDLSIAHLLIDEFQDTSAAQIALFERLTAGWMPGDGRTLFAVGDPMQSIYRFREAEVRLFLEAQQTLRIGNVPLTFIDLTRNFRSQAMIVEWVNDVFPQAFAARDDPWRSAVAYAASAAACPALASAPTIELYADTEAEADGVVAHVKAAQAVTGQRIAILVRARSHLDCLLPALHRAGIAFAAVDLESLVQRQAIIDLLSLTHALTQPADRLAWLAVLRAPWCGVELSDLFALAQAADTSNWCEAVTTSAVRTLLSPDGAARMERFAAVIRPALESRGRASLVARVRGTWLALGGPACIAEPLDLDAAERFFGLLGEHESAGDIRDYDAFRSTLEDLMAAPFGVDEAEVSVMTLHKAKGLQFDTVILPALDRISARSGESLLRWRMRPHGLLLAPRNARGASDDPVYRYVGDLADDEEDAELARLLYVGCTRAKAQLHLTATLPRIRTSTGGLEWDTPRKRSALAKLWPALRHRLPGPVDSEATRRENSSPRFLMRLPLGYQLPQASPSVPFATSSVPHERTAREFDWAHATAAAIGTVAHRVLAQLGRDGIETWNLNHQRSMRGRIERELANEGVDREAMASSVNSVCEVIDRVTNDVRGRWLFEPTHENAQSELALAGDDDGALVHVTLDRTFVADGVRWIVDFKTGRHEGADVARFMDTEVERYNAQLERYARVMRRLDRSLPVRLALYYPLVEGGWREWDAAC
jgi:ATP-dependent exoDNAse (exonuclease V) beta subunit